MLNNNNQMFSISVPNGPYPKCINADCDGVMLPIIEPATGRYYPGLYSVWVQGTATLFWKCGKCKVIHR